MLYPTIQHLKVANTHKNKNTGMQKQNVLRTCMHQGHSSFQLPNMERNHLNPLFSLNPPDSNSFWSILVLFQFISLLFQPFLVLLWPVSASLWVIPSHPASFHSVPAFSNTHPFLQALHFTEPFCNIFYRFLSRCLKTPTTSHSL